ncbi:hypothetical protein [Streptomyces sp. CAU 1734]|uniref:hypothetical protein n=1 Tax=Streptomyces sp. CAU 1734 TaxID=3140360 RepID=UPI00326099A5
MKGKRLAHRRFPLAVVAITGSAVMALAACDPSGGGLNAGSVALTTDRATTKTLERLGTGVRWFSCTAEVGGGGASATPAPDGSAGTVACEGETDTKQQITLKGKVTDDSSATCVRGDLMARIEEQVAFEATFLGDCGTRPSRETRPPGEARPSSEARPAAVSSREAVPGRPGPTVTVTHTKTRTHTRTVVVTRTVTATVTRTATATVTATRTVTAEPRER